MCGCKTHSERKKMKIFAPLHPIGYKYLNQGIYRGCRYGVMFLNYTPFWVFFYTIL